MRLLLEAGFDVGVKNAGGWTVIEEAVVHESIPMLRLLLDASHDAHMRMWREKKPKLLEAMRAMPNFKMRMNWEFGSPVFSSIVKQLAPYDEYTIWKHGSRLRIDASIVGFEGMRWVRGNVSLRFDGTQSHSELLIVNHDERKVFVKDAGMFSGAKDGDSLDSEVEFLLSSEIVQINVNTANTIFEPVKMRMKEGIKTEQVGAWNTMVYAAASDLEVERRSKTGVIKFRPTTFAEYIAGPPEDPDAPTRKRRFRKKRGPGDEEEVQIIKKKATVRSASAGVPARALGTGPAHRVQRFDPSEPAGPRQHDRGLPNLHGAARGADADDRPTQQGGVQGTQSGWPLIAP